MGTEFISLIYYPGMLAFFWLCYRSVTSALPDRAVYLAALLIGLGLGVQGMVDAYRPSIPENWNSSFLTGWFFISASFWLIVTSIGAKLIVVFVRQILKSGTSSDGA